LSAKPSHIRLRLLCHGPTSAVREAAFAADEPLDAQGARMLGALSSPLAQADRCWSSPALAARQTAAGLGFNASVEPLLRDCDYGRWAGRTLEDVEREEPGAVGAWLRDLDSAPHGGESIVDLIERVAAWLEIQGQTPGRVVAVTHASVIRAAIVHAIGAPPHSFWRIDVGPLALARLSGADGRWTLASIGRIESRLRVDADPVAR
jgi:broad specificity phosphatase PhoE